MTEVTHARMWRIAGPIVLSNATVPLLGAVDTGVVGQLGQAAPIGAVGLGAVILATVFAREPDPADGAWAVCRGA